MDDPRTRLAAGSIGTVFVTEKPALERPRRPDLILFGIGDDGTDARIDVTEAFFTISLVTQESISRQMSSDDIVEDFVGDVG